MSVKQILLTLALTLVGAAAFAQTGKVTGQVKDAQTGEPVAFALVLEQGTNNATNTDADGTYSINVGPNASLLFTLVGYNDVVVPVQGRSVINVEMGMSDNFLDEAVVSALGITRSEKTLTYAAQTVSSEELTVSRTPNMIAALAGKAAGVTINESTAGMGGSARVSIRGYRSAQGNNAPLYIINGVPMNNSKKVSTGTYGGSAEAGYDTGDGISNINPEDIESISILKGASASALYGTQAANGVIIINTKKGKAGQMHVDYTNTTNFEKAAYGIALQRTYGESDGMRSWGNKLSSPATLLADDFFKTAVTETNTIAMRGGTEKNQTYLSYANTYANSILDNGGKLSRHNISLRNTTQFTENLNLDVSVNLTSQYVKNRPSLGGTYMNPLFGVYQFPVGRDYKPWKDNYEVYDPERNLMAQSWIKTPDSNTDQNPWWLIKKLDFEAWRSRVIATAALRWDITPDMYIQLRGGADYISDRDDRRTSATAPADLIGSLNGRYATSTTTRGDYYTDLLYGYKHTWGDFGLNATVGGSIKYGESYGVSFDSYYGGGLKFANIFTIRNINEGGQSQSWYQNTLAALFATATLSWQDWLFMDLTARNDWSSSLAYTDSFKKGFFYPSVGLSAILNEVFEMPSWIDLFKVRASYSVVGNDIPSRISMPTGSINNKGNIESNTTAPFGDLKPETSGSYEFGADIRLFNNRLSFDVTYYHTNTTNQLFDIPAPSGSGYTRYWVNSGNIMNKGFEATIGIVPVETRNFTWNSTFNMSRNINKIVSLHETLETMEINGDTNQGYSVRLTEGGSYGDLYGPTFERDANGKLLLDDQGLPYKTQAYGLIGNTQPKFILGWNNTFDWQNVSLSFLIDARFGGCIMSFTHAELDVYGTTQLTADSRDQGYVEYEGMKFNDVRAFYGRVAGRGGIKEYYTYDATNIRLSEVSLGYTFPKSWLNGCKLIQSVNVSAVGRNLFFFYKKTDFDPNASISADDSYTGLETFSAPGTRQFGFNVKISF